MFFQNVLSGIWSVLAGKDPYNGAVYVDKMYLQKVYSKPKRIGIWAGTRHIGNWVSLMGV